MRIAVNLYDISKVGGIWTFHDTLVKGLKGQGADVSEYFLHFNKSQSFQRKESDEIEDGINRLESLGFMTDELLKEFKRTMNQFDGVIFIHPCPHHNKGFQSERWKGCYDINVPRIAVFHDPMAETHYKWIKNVPIDYAVAVQEKATISLQYLENPITKKTLIRHPLELSDMNFNYGDKSDWLICPHQFKSWKRMDVVISAIPGMNPITHIFGKGTEYFYMRRVSYPYSQLGERKPSKATRQFQKCLEIVGKGAKIKYPPQIWKKYEEYGTIWKDAMDSGKLVYHSVTPRKELEDTFKKSIGIIDMSIGEHGKKYSRRYHNFTSMNYSLLEGMKYACMPIVSKYSVQAPFDERNFIVISEKETVKDLTSKVNILAYSTLLPVIKANQMLLLENFSHFKIARQYIDLLNGKYDENYPNLKKR